jgi:CubicO group peptidase (beta-lactamase class C family)
MKFNGRSATILCCIVIMGMAAFLQDCASVSMPHDQVFPGKKWEKRPPEYTRVDPLILENALQYLSTNSGGCGTDEMVIARNGYMIWEGPGKDNKHQIYSCTKTFTSTVLGVLATRQKLDIDDLAVDYFPELDDGDSGQAVYNRVRFRDLATMTAGYLGAANNCWSLHLQGLHDESYQCTQTYTIPGKPQYLPRTKFSYRDPNVHVLGYILTKIAGRSLAEVFREAVAEKIGMMNWDWSDYGYRDGMFFNNPAGTPHIDHAKEMNEVQGGVWTTPKELARLGLLYLNNGNWDGEQILDSVFVKAAISNQVPAELPAIGTDLAGRYGFYWWTNGIRKDGTRPWPSAPPHTAMAHGYSRNFCMVIPEWNMVIVRMSPISGSGVPKNGDELWESFFNLLTPGISIK